MPVATRNTTQPTSTANANPFASVAGGQGNLFSQPITNEDWEALNRSLMYYPLQPNTMEGNNVWQQQLCEWRTKHGEGQVTAATGFPLCPGGAKPGSEECFLCGQVGHRRDSGQCAIVPINGRECTF